MTIAIFLLLLTGLCWVGIAAVVSFSAERELDLEHIQFCSSLLIVLAAGLLLIFQAPAEKSSGGLWVALPVFLAGGMNFLMLTLMKKAMRSGHPGAVWGITQSSLMCPFLMGILFFGVTPTFSRLGGLLLILGGITLFSRTKPGGAATGYRWLIPALGAFAASGAAQCMGNLPSYFQMVPLSSFARCLLVHLGTAGAFCLVCSVGRKKRNVTGTLWPAAALTLVQLLTLCFFFYNGLNRAAAAGAGSIGYPIAQGSCIIFYMLYEALFRHKKTPPGAWGGAVLLCAGILLIAL